MTASLTLNDLRGVVADDILVRARDTSAQLTELGVPHLLIGGVAVGLHGHPRATRDVDFMVGPEAFASSPILVYREELKGVARTGFTDLNAPEVGVPLLHEELRTGELPLVSLHGLLLMKLIAHRPQDIADVRALTSLHAQAKGSFPHYVRQALGHDRDRLNLIRSRFAQILQQP